MRYQEGTQWFDKEKGKWYMFYKGNTVSLDEYGGDHLTISTILPLEIAQDYSKKLLETPMAFKRYERLSETYIPSSVGLSDKSEKPFINPLAS